MLLAMARSDMSTLESIAPESRTRAGDSPGHSRAAYSVAASSIPADSIAGDEIAKVTDSIASPARSSDGTKPILSVTHTLTSVTQAAYSFKTDSI